MMAQQLAMDTVAFGISFFGLLALFAVLLLLVYLATKASGRTIGIFLAAGILLLLLYGWIADGSRRRPAAVLTAVSEEAVESGSKKPAISNQELWDRLTKSRIKLDSELEDVPTAAKEDAAKEGKDETTEKSDADSEHFEPKAVARPDWVDNPPKRVGNVYRRVVSSGPFSTVDECQLQLGDQLREAVRERLQTLIADEAASSILAANPSSLGIGLDYITREICKDEFTETYSASFGEMWQVHLLLEFSPAVEKHLRTAWKKQERRHRLGVVGKSAALALSLLASLYGLLKFDTWTRGYYTKRLLVGASVAIILVVILNLA